MKSIIPAFTLLLITTCVQAQTNPQEKMANDIVAKAKTLYDLQVVALFANDSVSKKATFQNQVSYKKDGGSACVFYNAADTIVAEFDFNTGNNCIKANYMQRYCNPTELRLIKTKRFILDKLSKGKLKKVNNEPGELYTCIPIVSGQSNICYLINTTNAPGKVILGKDYKVVLDSNMNVTSVTGDHKSVQVIDASKQGVVAFCHTHVIYDSFFETEIATLMINKNKMFVSQFVVISRSYTSTWDNATGELTIK